VPAFPLQRKSFSWKYGRPADKKVGQDDCAPRLGILLPLAILESMLPGLIGGKSWPLMDCRAAGPGQSQNGAFPSIYPYNDREEIMPIHTRIALLFYMMN